MSEQESEISKLATLGFLMLMLAIVQLGLLHFAYAIFGIIGGILAVGALIAFWMWLLDYNPGIDYYRRRSGPLNDTKEV